MARKKQDAKPQGVNPSRSWEPQQYLLLGLLCVVALVAVMGILMLRGNGTPAGRATTESLLLGAVDDLSSSSVRGWVLDAGRPAETIEFAVYVDDELFARRATDDLREDVNQFFTIRGVHGFQVSLAPAFEDSQSHRVRIEAVSGERTVVIRDEVVE